MNFYLISESCGLQVRRFRNVLIGRHRNRMKPYEKQEQMFYHYSHSIRRESRLVHLVVRALRETDVTAPDVRHDTLLGNTALLFETQMEPRGVEFRFCPN